MNATEFSQVQVDPEDKTPDLLKKLSIETEYDDDDIKWPSWLKLWMGKQAHRAGIHTWVRWRHYDKASDTIIEVNGVICQFCPRAKLL